MNIATTDARGLFTKTLIAAYREKVMPTSFFRSFFKVVESASKNVSIEVSRGTEKVAVDVYRGTEGNRNAWSKSTEKIFFPPFYREFYDCTEMDLYDRLFASTSDEISGGAFAQFIRSNAEKLAEMQAKIERAYELQCAQVLLDGIVQISAGININYGRKAGSLVNLANTWNNPATDVFQDFQDAAYFIRTEGKVQTHTFNVILGGEMMSKFLANDKVLARQNLFHMQLDSINPPQKNSVGGVYHGTVTAGPYRFNLWTYPEYYENAAGDSVPYMDEKKFIVLPEVTNFVLAYAAVPQLIGEGMTPVKGAFMVSEYIDERMAAHIIDLKSAGIAIPVAVDTIYTAQGLT